MANPNIVVGNYTYYDDPDDSQNFERNVLYHYPFIGDRLIIGKFCAVARGVKFIMNGPNHKMSGISTYPFSIFGKGWEKVMPHDRCSPPTCRLTPSLAAIRLGQSRRAFQRKQWRNWRRSPGGIGPSRRFPSIWRLSWRRTSMP